MIIPQHGAPKKSGVSQIPSRRPRPFPIWAMLIVGLLVVVIGIRMALPHYLLKYANHNFDKIPEYKGHIEDVDLSLLRGAYTIKGLKLEKISGAPAEPFFSATKVDLSVEWRALLHGSFVGEAELFDPKLNFVVAETKKASQTTIDSSWQGRAKKSFPLQMNRIRIHNGEIHFRDLTRTSKVDIRLDQVEAEGVGLTNHPGKGESLPATFHGTGRAMDEAQLRVDLRIDPVAQNPTFDMDAELKELNLTTLNDFLKAYADVEAKGGTFALYSEMAADHGRFKGYVKPLIKDFKVFSPGKHKEGMLQTAWEAVVEGVASIFENKGNGQLASQIPLSGRFANPQAGIIPSVSSLLRNAFIRALSPDLTHTITFKDVSGGKPTKGAGTVKNEDMKKAEKAGKSDVGVKKSH